MSTQESMPRLAPGLAAERVVSPGETPPVETGISGISYPEPPTPRKAWGPVSLTLIIAVVILVAVGLIGMVTTLNL
ncbi:DUF6480 family protein [Streptomyces fructofermentans]|uniref:Uncharacterized protein n=1 Tax=Streptomyces fructofermentans TaxID=152141 RepID=A0A918KVT1_9ACTN|nr:DUF6480 family protein [Streptomyces fructofermentans]GGX76357.1 hypothetical protein GCM10010515_50120 [Streptomyces fructofermentans]